MKTYLIAVLVLLTPIFTSAAPVSTKAVEDLLDVLHEEEQLEEVFTTMNAVNRQGFGLIFGGGRPLYALTADQRRAVDIAVAKAEQIARSELTWSVIKPPLVELIREAFSQEEIDDIVVFYKTPSGQAYIRKFPPLKKQSAILLQERVQALASKIEFEVQNALRAANLMK